MANGQSNFLPVPTKKSHPVPNFTTQILAYISNHFRDAHPDAFKKDVDTLAGLRRDWVEIKGDLHPEIVRGLMRYVPYLIICKTQADKQISRSIDVFGN